MASYNEKASPADVAAVWAIVFLAAVLAVLVGTYFWRQYSFADKVSASSEITGMNVIEPEKEVTSLTETTASVTTTVSVTTSETETSMEVTSEPEKAETIAASKEYDSEFFDRGLIIGDSISVGLVNYGYLKPENVFAQIGLTPASVLTTDINGTTVYTKAAGLNPDYICIMLGTNGLSYLSEDFMAEKMGEFIDGLRQTCPNAKIFLISIPPVTAEHESEKPEKIENITKYNEHIAKLAEEKSVPFVNTFILLQDSDGYLAADYAEYDGLHLKGAAYPVLLSAIQTAVESDSYAPTSEPVTAPTETDAAVSETVPAASTTVETTTSVPETLPEQEEIIVRTAVVNENEEIIQ